MNDDKIVMEGSFKSYFFASQSQHALILKNDLLSIPEREIIDKNIAEVNVCDTVQHS